MAAVEATVFGATGFIGRAVSEALRAQGLYVWCPTRADIASGAGMDRSLGHVVYAIGLTGNFRTMPVETVEAHAAMLARVLHGTRWDSFLALSSTRVYGARGDRPAREGDPITLVPSADSLYDLSKLLGDALVLSHPSPTARVARLSNVFGEGMHPSTFLASILNEAASGDVTLREDPASAKDYVPLAFAAGRLTDIVLSGRERIYNVASGAPLSHEDVAELLAETLGITISYAPGAPLRRLAEIDTGRLTGEFGSMTRRVEAELTDFFRARLRPAR
ncbi:NAD(P)-dependent oxidoreductase [Acuticoccus sp. MNP-M23]|uniref:NAD-dependent epimerase/dehydratase family protein n=1 Tax=Acuticoccus sp. MNP-M23 TaxID=3072793 RepID=UPI00281522BE|nr:NAD(P)-dependent oxidoreductase [Acuticoccus sp. MNP-M23]WMS43024.1 NAD(P)-dependent oxidoreductase [Acuticoccus sp. MNP-M23]